MMVGSLSYLDLLTGFVVAFIGFAEAVTVNNSNSIDDEHSMTIGYVSRFTWLLNY